MHLPPPLSYCVQGAVSGLANKATIKSIQRLVNHIFAYHTPPPHTPICGALGRNLGQEMLLIYNQKEQMLWVSKVFCLKR